MLNPIDGSNGIKIIKIRWIMILAGSFIESNFRVIYKKMYKIRNFQKLQRVRQCRTLGKLLIFLKNVQIMHLNSAASPHRLETKRIQSPSGHPGLDGVHSLLLGKSGSGAHMPSPVDFVSRSNTRLNTLQPSQHSPHKVESHHGQFSGSGNAL